MVLSSLLAPGSKKAVHRDPALIPGQQEPQGYRDRCRAWMGNLCCAFQQGPNGNSESITHNAPPKQQRAGVLPLTPRNAHQQVNARAPLRWGKGRAIAEGGFGKVYAGLNLDTGELLAIKQVLVPEVMAKKDVERIKEIEDEIAVLSKLQHPNIVRYFGTERSKESLNILLEYAGGGSVTSLLQKYGPFPERVIQVNLLILVMLCCPLLVRDPKHLLACLHLSSCFLHFDIPQSVYKVHQLRKLYTPGVHQTNRPRVGVPTQERYRSPRCERRERARH